MAMSLTHRDRQLLGVLAESRYLSSQQVQGLFFPERDESVVRRRLRALSCGSDQVALIERTKYPMSSEVSGMGTVWSLTEAGWAEVEAATGDVFERPAALQSEYLKHHLLFTSLYVGLLAAPLQALLRGLPTASGPQARRRALLRTYASVSHPAWQWYVTGDALQLPWRQYQSGEQKERLIRPDAILELKGLKRRLFIEGETGTHTIKARSSDKHGSTIAKAMRYEDYATGWCDVSMKRTWYQSRFVDGFRPELIFLVPSEGRATNVQKALAEWGRVRGNAPRLPIRAITAERLLAELHPQLGQVVAPVDARSEQSSRLSDAELLAVENFFLTTREDLKRRQAAAQRDGLPLPVVPKAYDEVKAAVSRLRTERQRGQGEGAAQ